MTRPKLSQFLLVLVASAGWLASSSSSTLVFASPGAYDLFTEPMKLFKEPAKLIVEPAKLLTEQTKLLTEQVKLLREPTKLLTEQAKLFSAPMELVSGTAKSVTDSVQGTDSNGGGGSSSYYKDKEQSGKPKLFGSLAKTLQSMLEKYTAGSSGGGGGGVSKEPEGLAKFFPYGKSLGSLVGLKRGARSLQLTPTLLDGPTPAASSADKTTLSVSTSPKYTPEPPTNKQVPANKSPTKVALPGLLGKLVSKHPALEKWFQNFSKYLDLSKVWDNFGQVLKKGGGSSSSTLPYDFAKIGDKIKDGWSSISKGQGAGASGGPLGMVTGMLKNGYGGKADR